MYEEMLFIGGPADGKRLVIKADVCYIIFENPMGLNVEANLSIPENFSTTSYVRRKVKGSTKEFKVMCPFDMSGDEVIEKLIANYIPSEDK